ncbi:hypothetical protein EVAR_39179_1 [Eumeta japonica]|uniref:Uncharacterized protein n=1 Tax=Eumeta variegata TaxID=151549 RepID=A0A4C1VMR9_EUMVA|nr:hypothetical protein EVAR_39179_1 [Eumeta japonica]
MTDAIICSTEPSPRESKSHLASFSPDRDTYEQCHRVIQTEAKITAQTVTRYQRRQRAFVSPFKLFVAANSGVCASVVRAAGREATDLGAPPAPRPASNLDPRSYGCPTTKMLLVLL